MKMPEILIKDDARYASVALFVDQEKILRFVEKMRKRFTSPFEKTLLPYPYENKFKIGSHFFYKRTKDHIIEEQEIRDQLTGLNHWSWTEEREALEDKLKTLENDALLFERDVESYLEKTKFKTNYKNILIKQILHNEVRELDFLGHGMKGRFELIKKQRESYWINKRSGKDTRLGYKRLSKTDLGNGNKKTMEQRVRSYQDRLEEFRKGLDLG